MMVGDTFFIFSQLQWGLMMMQVRKYIQRQIFLL
jgi:hypothetical protein